jgi:hypothetical protein
MTPNVNIVNPLLEFRSFPYVIVPSVISMVFFLFLILKLSSPVPQAELSPLSLEPSPFLSLSSI